MIKIHILVASAFLLASAATQAVEITKEGLVGLKRAADSCVQTFPRLLVDLSSAKGELKAVLATGKDVSKLSAADKLIYDETEKLVKACNVARLGHEAALKNFMAMSAGPKPAQDVLDELHSLDDKMKSVNDAIGDAVKKSPDVAGILHRILKGH